MMESLSLSISLFVVVQNMCTPLMKAATNGHLDVVKLLLATSGVDIHARDSVIVLNLLTNDGIIIFDIVIVWTHSTSLCCY